MSYSSEFDNTGRNFTRPYTMWHVHVDKRYRMAVEGAENYFVPEFWTN